MQLDTFYGVVYTYLPFPECRFFAIFFYFFYLCYSLFIRMCSMDDTFVFIAEWVTDQKTIKHSILNYYAPSKL